MPVEAEAFYLDDHGVGAILRWVTESALVTRTVFHVPGGPTIGNDQVTRFASGLEQWHEFGYVDRLDGVDIGGRLSRNSVLTVAGESRPLPDDCVPSYAAHLVLLGMLRDGRDTLEFHQFDESTPFTVLSAAFRSERVETIEIPWGSASVECTRIGLTVEGQRINTFWASAGGIVKSDWGGSQSYATSDREFLVANIAEGVAAAIGEFFANHGISE